MSEPGNQSNCRLTNPMLELFCIDAQDSLATLRQSLLQLRSEPNNADALKQSDVALTSIKGASKIASLDIIFDITKNMEGIIAAVTQGKIVLNSAIIDAFDSVILLVLDVITAADTDLIVWFQENENKFSAVTSVLESAIQSDNGPEIIPGSKSEIKSELEQNIKADKFVKTNESLADFSMLELYRMEAESQTSKLSNGLMELENNPNNADILEALMRAAHSIKGAARMVGIDSSVRIAHLMEDVFVAAQQGNFTLQADDMDILLACVDILVNIADATLKDYDSWLLSYKNNLDEICVALSTILQQQPRQKLSFDTLLTENTVVSNKTDDNISDESKALIQPDLLTDKIDYGKKTTDNVVRVTAESLNRLQGLAGEALVESRWLGRYSESLLQVKKRQTELVIVLDHLREQLFDVKSNEVVDDAMRHAQVKANECRELLSSRLLDLESYDRRSSNLSRRLHQDVLQARMRPFADGVQGFQRLVRELGRSLDKDIKLDIIGMDTQVDRDILDKLQAPLNHMIRNAVDHGIETANERTAMGKPAQGKIKLEALHIAGMLSIIVEDDGRGIDLQLLKKKIIAKNMVSEKMAQNLSEHELLDFMFLPNFSTRDNVTELSGRGVGLDVVHKVVQELRGQIRSSTELGKGMRFQYQLPLTLSVVRALVVDIGGEPYAFPLARIDQTLKIDQQAVETMEGRQYFTYGNLHIGLITAHQILEKDSAANASDNISIVVLSDRLNKYGIIVDQFLGERNLVVHSLDPRLGKIQDISSASLTENGEPLLIFDVDDLFRSIDLILSGGRLSRITKQTQDIEAIESIKRILVVDDSITVREVERNLLQSKGYIVEVAVDGMDGWNAARTSDYDLIVSDIDMPRMNGFEFVEKIKADDRLQSIPVIIVSYKDREQDRMRGLEVGADYYLTKGSFHDDTLVEAVMDLIGEP